MGVSPTGNIQILLASVGVHIQPAVGPRLPPPPKKKYTIALINVSIHLAEKQVKQRRSPGVPINA